MYWELVAYRPVAYKKIVLVVLFFMSYNDILIKLIIKYAIKNTIKYKKLLKRHNIQHDIQNTFCESSYEIHICNLTPRKAT